MFKQANAFNSFAVPDLEAAKQFYGETLGIDVTEEEEVGVLGLGVGGGQSTMVYPKPDHTPANYTVLNFPVDDIDAAVDELSGRRVEFERYDGFEQDEKGIARSSDSQPGPSIAWFTDPAGNVLAVIEAD